MDRVIARLGSGTSKRSVNKDVSLNISAENKFNHLPYGDINKILNVSERFDYERNISGKYRFLFTINQMLTNILTDITFNGFYKDSLSMFGEELFMKDGDGNILFDNIVDSINNYLIIKDGWLGYYVPAWYSESKYPDFNYIGNSNINSFVELQPKRTILEFITKNGVKNWDLAITYPSSHDGDHSVIKDGILIVNTGIGTIGVKQLKLVTVPIKHNLLPGDSVKINNKIYTVLRVGDDGGMDKEYKFVINIPYNDVSVMSDHRIVKVYNGKDSVYYMRKFKKITDITDYETYPIAFSRNMYNDRVCQVAFNSDIDISLYNDNLGRPLSEVYLTVVKKSNNSFTGVKSGLDIGDVSMSSDYVNISMINRIHNLIPTPWPESDYYIEDTISISNDEFYGDIVEYNEHTVEEIVLCDIMHRFNRTDRDNTGRPEGYMYKPHNKIPLRYWSTFIEQGDSSTYNLPYYAQSLGDGRYLWRDLLNIGINDGQDSILDYPFLNGCHYIHSNIDFMLRRQDPFNKYNLYYTNIPRDIYGGKSYLDDLIVRREDTENGCC